MIKRLFLIASATNSLPSTPGSARKGVEGTFPGSESSEIIAQGFDYHVAALAVGVDP